MNIQQLLSASSAYWESAAIMAAVELDLFAYLAEGSVSLEKLCEQTNWPQEQAGALLEALVGIGVLKQEKGFSISPNLQRYLDPESPDNFLAALRFNQDLYALWGGLAETVKTGEPRLSNQSHLGRDPAQLERFVRGMHSRAALLAPALVAHLPLGGVTKLLDVAGGPGTLSLALLEAHPSLEVELFELPAVAEVAQRIHQGHPALDRLSFSPGDYHRDVLPTGNTAVLYCGALHQETLVTAPCVFASIHKALPSGGRIMLVDLLVDDSRTAPAFASLFGLNMMLMRESSHMFSYGEAIGALEEAGFIIEHSASLPQTPYGVILGRRA